MVPNNLATTHLELTKQWHPTKNGNLTPYDVSAGSNKKVWWKCPSGDDHEWLAIINNRTKGQGCSICKGKKVVKSNCLTTRHPDLAQEWHPTKNGLLKPENFTAGSNKYVSWLCKKGHEYISRISRRTAGHGCPYCSGHKLSRELSLGYKRPDLAAEFHPSKNGLLVPDNVHASSGQMIWWLCQNDQSHEWESTVDNRNKGNGCPFCSGKKLSKGNSFGDKFKYLLAEWDYEKNVKDPYALAPYSNKRVYWVCKKNSDHKWQTSIAKRASGTGCPYCKGNKVIYSNSLEYLRPDIAKEWHSIKNGNLKPSDFTIGSSKKVWWQCAIDTSHEWKTAIHNRAKRKTGCSVCKSGWTIEKVRDFVKSILDNIDKLCPAELYTIFQQSGILYAQGKSELFLKNLRTGKFPKEELQKFVDNKPSLVDEFLNDKTKVLEDEELITESISERGVLRDFEELPIIETKDILLSFDQQIRVNFDQEAVEFLINSAVAKIWKHAFFNEEQAKQQLNDYNEGIYAQEVKKLFLEQYNGAKDLLVPDGYSFHSAPNLMQRFTAYMVKSRKRFGNWSGTGAGKTLSAILASRVIVAQFTIICCPNSVVNGWEQNIKLIYSDSTIFKKDLDINLQVNKHHYLILNYEFFQQPKAGNALKKLLKQVKVDFVVIDEIHFSKQREVGDLTKRKKVINALLSQATSINENLHVLGMSATPVINNLFEGKSLLEMVRGVHYDELNTKATVNNCISLYQKFVSHGVRWVPRYSQKINIKPIEVDCSEYINEIKKLNVNGRYFDLEVILSKAKVLVILENIKPKTIIYTHYIKNILEPLREALQNRGWKTVIFTGEDKTGFDKFRYSDAEVLIATASIGTGVDGLQKVCNRIIINSLPWTSAEFEQVKGRIYRQGQKSDTVDIIVPLTYSIINGQRWSWCESRWKRIQFKKSIADAAVDGEIPEGHLRTPAQAYQDLMEWLNKLESGEVNEVQRRKINIALSDEPHPKFLRKFGDFSKMNRRINSAPSSETHKRFRDYSEEFEHYHSVYREQRKNWEVVPYKEAIKFFKKRSDLIIGDFGCGEAFLAKELENKVYSIDHVAINENVMACDMANVPLDDEMLDAVVFSLSLMGANYIDYLRQAYRCLKLDGHLWIAEPTDRIKDFELFRYLLDKLGFDVVAVNVKGQFTFIRAFKSSRQINEVALKNLNPTDILS